MANCAGANGRAATAAGNPSPRQQNTASALHALRAGSSCPMLRGCCHVLPQPSSSGLQAYHGSRESHLQRPSAAAAAVPSTRTASTTSNETKIPLASSTATSAAQARPNNPPQGGPPAVDGDGDGRLFCNLNPKDLSPEPGSVWGATMLVAGTTVGAGILALPAVTQVGGQGRRGWVRSCVRVWCGAS